MTDPYLLRLIESLFGALDFPEGTRRLHGLRDCPWRVPVVGGYRSRVSEVEMLLLMWSLVVMIKPQLVIETGTDSGIMARALGLACRANGGGRVLSAEIDARLVKHARELVRGLRVKVFCKPALELPIEDADLLFLDSSYESRLAELGRIKPGAVAVVHDTSREPEFGARVRASHPRHIAVDTPRGFTIVQK